MNPITHKLTIAEVIFRIFLVSGVVAAVGIPYYLRDAAPPAIYGPLAKSYELEIVTGLQKVGASTVQSPCLQTNKRLLKVWCASTQTTPDALAQYFISNGWVKNSGTDINSIVLLTTSKRMRIRVVENEVIVSIEEATESQIAAPISANK